MISDQKLVQTGWLGKETLVELKLYEKAIHIWKKKHQDKDLYVKVTPVDVAVASQQSFSMDLEESLDINETREKNKVWPIVNVAVRIIIDSINICRLSNVLILHFRVY